ncbi:MAG: DEAD/DEAH box helicase [Solirubrobacteraceae bacterium]
MVSDLDEVELPTVEAAVGARSFQRGSSYARGNRVLRIEWDPGTTTLTGSVVGHGALYETAAFFAAATDGESAPTFRDGECTCPVGYNCKHVAAIVIAASVGVGAELGRPGRLASVPAVSRALPQIRAPEGLAPSPRRTASKRPSPLSLATPLEEAGSWETSLRALVEAPAVRSIGSPLAIELKLHWSGVAGAGPPRLLARLMREGARGGWINGSLRWDGLDSWQLRDGEHRLDHLDLVRELYAIFRARDVRASYHYGYGADKALDLGSCDSARLWSLFEDAERLDLKLMHPRLELGEVRRTRGELLIDVTQASDRTPAAGWLVRAELRIDDSDGPSVSPLLFIGSSGHGLVCAERSPDDGAEGGGVGATDREGPERRRLLLVRLARPAPLPLQRMLIERRPLTIPPAELERFAAELCPVLRRLAPVVSSDGSFTPPEVSPPALVLRAHYGAEHSLDLGWEWAYRIGDAIRHAPFSSNGKGPGFRDLDAERALLAHADFTGSGLERFGLLDIGGQAAGADRVSLAGIDSMRLSTEVLPALAERPDVTVEVLGEPPDYRDVGGSLRIGLSTAEIVDDRDWFDLGVTIAVEGRELPFAAVFAALARGESQMLLDDGAHFSLLAPELQELRRLIEEAAVLSDSPPERLRISRYQAGLWAELAALGVVTEQARAWQRQVGTLLELDSLVEHALPEGLQATLRPYQREGFGWLASLWDLELGGVLADDMGLGKTLQVLALICHARERDPNIGPFLVVAPTSVVPGWVSEAARFAPDLRVDAVTDTLARSGRTVEQVAAANVVVTTYTLFRLEVDAYRAVKWAGLILDEAQYVKNHQSKTYRCVRELDAPFKLAMTGTPMENNLMELWSQLSIAAPGLFPDPKRFAEQYARPIERSGDGERLQRLRRRIKPLIKRRTKDLVAADLPPKQEQTLQVHLHPRHRKLYETRLQRERQKVLGLLGDFNRHRFEILRSITLLRQLSLHAGLVADSSDKLPCAKLDTLVEQLADVLGGGHRALVFSQFTGFLAKARERLDSEGVGYCYLDGRTRRRERVIERFRDGEDPVFLISLKAGGVGLNLTEADYCFLLDPWWNPATEAQAIDRAHRIGQTRPVNVYRLIAHETIEEKVAALAQRKAALFSGVMDDGDLFASNLTAEDVRGLLG